MIDRHSSTGIGMTLQQLEAICAIVRHRCNISAAAQALSRTQSGLSRQIKELERELGVQIFVRTRNKVVGLTHHGEKILGVSERVLREISTLEQIGADGCVEEGGEIRIATTHVHARYLLPETVRAFTQRFPRTALTLQQCDPDQCRDAIAAGNADLGIITMSQKAADTVVAIPAYKLSRCVIVPSGHPLARNEMLSLEELSEYPLIAYPTGFSGRSLVEDAFARAGLKPRIVCSATDADVCKAYVKLGMGVAVLAKIAFDPLADRGLVALDAGHLFQPGMLNVVFRKHGYMTRPLECFLSLFAPHLDRAFVLNAVEGAHVDRASLGRRAPFASASA
jgi:LysR family transcriptional regulator, cys regulon transcriptional activator